jgi:hypothetical protein
MTPKQEVIEMLRLAQLDLTEASNTAQKLHSESEVYLLTDLSMLIGGLSQAVGSLADHLENS